jgi:hypothetical protein
LPSGAAVNGMLSGHPNVTTAMTGSGHNTTFLGASLLGGAHTINAATASEPAISEMQTMSSEYVIDATQVDNSGELVVGLLDPSTNTIAAANFVSLEFTIQRDGATIPGQDYTFTDVATARSFFEDHVLDLGSITDGVTNGLLDLDFQMKLTTLNQIDGFAADFIFGNVAVPEPASFGVVMMVGMLLCRSRRRC